MNEKENTLDEEMKDITLDDITKNDDSNEIKSLNDIVEIKSNDNNDEELNINDRDEIASNKVFETTNIQNDNLQNENNQNQQFGKFSGVNPNSFDVNYEDVSKVNKKTNDNKLIMVWGGLVLIFTLGLFSFVSFSAGKILGNMNQKNGNTNVVESVVSKLDKNSNVNVHKNIQKENVSKDVANTIIANDFIKEDGNIENLADIIENVMPSMVSITTKSTVSYYNPFNYGLIEEYEAESSGSGIIISQNENELLILTNEHVINSANEVVVGFIDDTSVVGNVRAFDVESDLAIITISIDDIKETTLNEIKIATMGDSNDLRLGETVVAIGNSLGYGQSVTKGIVSALDREIELEDGISRTFIQTDAAINPGNSGGALINMKGEVIGINESKIASSEIEGVGFAIPISNAKNIIDELTNREYREKLDESKRGYLGITCRDVDITTSTLYNIPVGVFVYDIQKGSTADKFGLIKGDVIIKFDDVTITNSDTLVDLVSRYGVGETIEIIILRYDNGEYVEKTIEVTLLDKQFDMTNINK